MGKKIDSEPDGRRADPNNPNRKMTFGFGFGCEKGTEIHQVLHRMQNSYDDFFVSKQPVDPKVFAEQNKERIKFNLSNNFKLGMDP